MSIEAVDFGIESRVPWDAYAAMAGLRISHLKEIARSPQHFLHGLHDAKRSKPLTLGAAAHCAVLEPERFNTDYAVWQRVSKSGNLCPRKGKYFKAFELEHEGKTIIDLKERDAALAIQRAVRSNPDAMRYLETGDPEVTLRWPLRGRQAKGRADWLTIDARDGTRVLLGLKTARDCRLYQFSGAAARYGYHLQWAYYFDGFNSITGEIPKVIEVVVESAPPHAVVVYSIPDEVIQQGRDEYEALLTQLAECERAGEWPGPAPGEVLFSLPTWAYHTQDDLSELGLEA